MRSARSLLLSTALAEAGAGVALLVAPELSVTLLLGRAGSASPPFVIERILGAALLSIAVACWIAHADSGDRLGRLLVAGLLIYNVAVPALLAYAALAYSFSSLVLWPACALHLGLAVWGVACLRANLPPADNGPKAL